MKMLRYFGVIIVLIGAANLSLAQDNTFYSESQIVEKQVQLYPNPATEYLVVKLSAPRANAVELAMHSVIGNTLNVDRTTINDYEVRLSVRDLPSGYYFLSIKDEESDLKSTYKFLKR